MSDDKLWQAVLGELELSLSKASFTTWFRHTFILRRHQDEVVVGVPNAFTKTWLENKYHQNILKTLRRLDNNIMLKLHYEVANSKDKERRQSEKNAQMKEAVFQQTHRPEAPATSPHNFMPRSRDAADPTSSLNIHYTFEKFIVGKGSELAKAACLAVARNPGLSYNPLFIYGGVGLGKTHLMQAIGHEIVRNSQHSKVLYVTCERFTNDFIKSVQEGKASQFKDTYRSVDVLLIDDIQFLAGKEGTQEEFFHTFNALHQVSKQIVISSDRPPKAIPDLENRLISRFEWGMIADVSSPDFETRVAILESKCKEKGCLLDRDIIQYIANSIQNNIRELEGALNKLIAHIELTNTPPSLEKAKNILYSLTSPRAKGALTGKQLLQRVATFYDIPIEAITGNSRKKELVAPRQIAIYLMREEIKSSYPSIGQELGGRDHTTAMHAYSKISRQIEVDEKVKQDVEAIRQQLYAR